MNYLCQLCSANCDEIGNPGAVVDPLAKTLVITCIQCRLSACAERSLGRPRDYSQAPRHRQRMETGNLPYKD